MKITLERDDDQGIIYALHKVLIYVKFGTKEYLETNEFASSPLINNLFKEVDIIFEKLYNDRAEKYGNSPLMADRWHINPTSRIFELVKQRIQNVELSNWKRMGEDHKKDFVINLFLPYIVDPNQIYQLIKYGDYFH